VILATKFGGEVDKKRKGARPEYVLQACEDSLQRLGTDYIDLYQQHKPDPTVPIAETLDALTELVKGAKVRQIGCSNFSAAQILEAEETSKRMNLARFVSVQNNYNMLEREAERDAIPVCEQLGLAFLPYFPLASGLLTGKFRRGNAPPPGTRLADVESLKAKVTDHKLSIVEQLIAFAKSRNHTLLELAMSWLLRLPVVASVIAGATKPAQVRANAAAPNWKLSESDIETIDRILAGG
jgi:aryl-alcohol dehydrogenase-like predicted oxidoreductase